MPRTPRSFVVLLVEDDPADRHLIVEALTRCGVPVSCVLYASNGKEALDLLERLDERESLPDLVLLDLNLPRFDGHEVLRELKRRGLLSHLYVMVLSTSSDHEDARRVYEAGGHSYLVKPDNFPRFVELMTCVGQFVLNTFQPSSLPRERATTA